MGLLLDFSPEYKCRPMKYINKLFLCLLLGTIVSCQIDDGDSDPVEFTPKLGTANIAILNTMTDTDDAGFTTVDIYADETKVMSEITFGIFSTGYMEHEFPQGTIFRAVQGGTAPVYLSNPVPGIENNITNATVAALLPESHNAPLQGQLKNGASYTVALLGNVNSIGFETFVMAEDDLTAPSGGSRVRFLNASIDNCVFNSCLADFSMNGTVLGTSDWGNQNGEAAFSDFVEVSETTLSLTITDPTDDTELFTGSVEVPAGGVYTVVFMGDSFSTVDGEGLQLTAFRHN